MKEKRLTEAALRVTTISTKKLVNKSDSFEDKTSNNVKLFRLVMGRLHELGHNQIKCGQACYFHLFTLYCFCLGNFVRYIVLSLS